MKIARGHEVAYLAAGLQHLALTVKLAGFLGKLIGQVTNLILIGYKSCLRTI